MGKGDTERPQQPELARSEHTQVDPRHWTEREESRGAPPDRGPSGPVPPENRPGPRPGRDQDKPEGPPRPAEAAEEEGTTAPEDPTVPADDAEPTAPGPGDSEGARPE